jgi:hypothetical protein
MSRPENSTGTSNDLTTITVLRSGRYLSYHTQLHPGDDPHWIEAAQCQVRGVYNNGHVARLVVIRGADVQTMEGAK